MSVETQRVLAALRARFDRDHYALLTEVTYQERRADAIAVSYWHSDDFALTGFEIKVDRGDWLRELKQPEKAERFTAHCTQWYVVATPGVVVPAEVPKGHGLLVVEADGKGGGMCRLAKPARRNKLVAPVPSRLWASLLRQAQKSSPMGGEFDAGVREGMRRSRNDLLVRSERERTKQQQIENEKRLAEWEAQKRAMAQQPANDDATAAKASA